MAESGGQPPRIAGVCRQGAVDTEPTYPAHVRVVLPCSDLKRRHCIESYGAEAMRSMVTEHRPERLKVQTILRTRQVARVSTEACDCVTTHVVAQVWS